jgi:transposase
MATRIIEVVDAGSASARRRFTDDDKARIVSEAMMPGATVTEVARRYGVCGSLIYRWRRILVGSSLSPAARSLPSPTGFVPVEVAPTVAPVRAGPLPGIVEVMAPSGHVVRLTPPIDARVLKVVLAGIG